MKKAIIIGASSGIGRALAVVLANNGYELGLMARRTELLETLKNEIPTESYIGYIDLAKTSDAIEKFKDMAKIMQSADLVIINSAVGFFNPKLEWSKEKELLDINIYGFCALAGEVYKMFVKQGKGHLVGISSIAALRGNPAFPAYSASKAFMSNYLEGLRKKAFQEHLSIVVTDIQPGYVDTAMAMGESKFWVASPETAAEQIYSAIAKQKSHAYITHRWRLIGWLLKLVPNCLYQRVG